MAFLVNGERVDDGVVKGEFQALRPRYEQMMADSEMDPVQQQIQLWEWSRENVIEKVLLRQEALKQTDPIPAAELDAAVEAELGRTGDNCPNPSNDEQARQEIEARLRLERLIQKVSSRAPNPKPSQVNEYYNRNKENFRTPEVVRAAHIVKHVNAQHPEEEARAVIEEALRELEAGRGFEEVADQYSDCPGNGGDLGFFPRGEMVEEFERALFQLEPGQRSGIFRTPFGFHIALLREMRPASYRPLPEVRQQITDLLWQERKEKALEEYVDRLRSKATVERVAEEEPVAAGGGGE